jgi:hypothetical protein
MLVIFQLKLLIFLAPTAPEVFLNPHRLETFENCCLKDWWVFGIVLYQLLSGKSPFSKELQFQLIEVCEDREIAFPSCVKEEDKEFVQMVTFYGRN